MISRRTLLVIAGGGTILAMPQRLHAAPAGEVLSLSGKAVASSAGVDRPLTAGAAVGFNDMVATGAGSRLALKLGPDTFINLGPETRLRIEPHLAEVGGRFDLVGGSMLMEHVKPAGAPASRAEVKSPYGLIAVRGTRFFAGRTTAGFGVFLAEGLVDFTGGGRTVSLKPGLGSDVARPGMRPSTPAAWRPARIAEVYRLTTGSPLPPKR